MKTLKILFALIAIAAIAAGCSSTRRMKTKYVDVEKVSESVDNRGQTVLTIDGEYLQSRYGFDTLNSCVIRDEMYITGIAEMGAKTPLDFKIKIPNNVNIVYLCYKEIWRRDSTFSH